MTIKGEKERDIFVVNITGRIDSSNSLSIEEHFNKWIEQGELKFVCDFTGLDYLSSAGLRVLIQALKKVTPSGGKLVICNLNEIVKNIFEISGLDSTFVLAKDKAVALSSF